MTTDQDFLRSFMTDCIQNGHKSTQEMCEQALCQIDVLEEEIKKTDLLRAKQTQLRTTIRLLGGSEIKRIKKKPMMVDASLSAEQLDPYMHEVCFKICGYIEQCDPKQVTVREINEGIQIPMTEFKAVLTGIKWLWDRGIIARNEETLSREISRGPNWDQRPSLKE